MSRRARSREMERHIKSEGEIKAGKLAAGEVRQDSRPYLIKIAAGVPVMVFPKRRNKKLTIRMWPESVEKVAEEGVCFAMEDKLESEAMEAQHPKHHLDKQTDEEIATETTQVSQVIPLKEVYEHAGLPPPVPPAPPPVPPAEGEETHAFAHKPPLEDETADPLIGKRVAGYVVEGSIAGGGMGVVYRARQPEIGRCVAIKVLRPESAVSQDQSNRFFQEAQVLSAIRHRSVTDIIQWGRLADGRPYIVMEYLEGDNLEDVMGRDGPMPVYRVIEIIGEVLDALSAAHKVGVVHRDLKPSNIFIVKQSDGTQCVKLLDFGLARQLPRNALDGALGDEGNALAAVGRPEKASTVAGTPEYIAPEQARGLAATPRTDIYSLGILTFEMLAGRLPFLAQSTVEMMKAHTEMEPPDIRELAENIPNTLAELLTSMLKKLPEERPRSTDEVKQRLHRISQQLKDEDTHVALRLPLPLLEEQAAQKATEKKFQRRWWPIAALPIVAGLTMYLTLRFFIPSAVSPVEPPPPGVQIIDMTKIADAPPPDVTPTDVLQPGANVETASTEQNTDSQLANASSSSPGNRPKPKPQPKPSTTEAPSKAPAAAAAASVRLQPVDCTIPADIWRGLMDQKLSNYMQQLTTSWRDIKKVKELIDDEFMVHKRKIENNDGSKETCEAISKNLDNWLKQPRKAALATQ